LEEIEADLDYTLARIKALELKAESQMRPLLDQEQNSKSSAFVKDDLFGEGNYRAALQLLHALESAEIPSMLELFLREIVAKRMEHTALTKKMNELDKTRVDLELFINTLKSTTATMTLNYEARIATLQNRLGDPNNDSFQSDEEGFDPFARHPDVEGSDSENSNLVLNVSDSMTQYRNSMDPLAGDLDLDISYN